MAQNIVKLKHLKYFRRLIESLTRQKAFFEISSVHLQERSRNEQLQCLSGLQQFRIR